MRAPITGYPDAAEVSTAVELLRSAVVRSINTHVIVAGSCVACGLSWFCAQALRPSTTWRRNKRPTSLAEPAVPAVPALNPAAGTVIHSVASARASLVGPLIVGYCASAPTPQPNRRTACGRRSPSSPTARGSPC